MILIMVALVHKQEASRVGRRGHLKFLGLRGTLRKVENNPCLADPQGGGKVKADPVSEGALSAMSLTGR